MVVTMHDVTSEYLSEVAGYIPLMWDIFLDTYRSSRGKYTKGSVRHLFEGYHFGAIFVDIGFYTMLVFEY